MTDLNRVAVWYRDELDRTTYDLFDDERTAALDAAGFEASNGPGSVLGVQFPDGRAVPAAEWAAMDEGRRRLRQFAIQNAQAVAVEPEPHTVRDPFTLTAVEVTCGDPAWLGLHDTP